LTPTLSQSARGIQEIAICDRAHYAKDPPPSMPSRSAGSLPIMHPALLHLAAQKVYASERIMLRAFTNCTLYTPTPALFRRARGI